MTKKYRKSLFIFRRDLRLNDNTALIEACRLSKEVVPIFIFDPRQVHSNPYKSENCLQFMVASLRQLDDELRLRGGRLVCSEGKAECILDTIVGAGEIDAVFINRDYTPFSLHRDQELARVAKRYSVPLEARDDALLLPPGAVLKPNGKPYTMFTPFYRAAVKQAITPPKRFSFPRAFTSALAGARGIEDFCLIENRNGDLALKGGRREGLQLLRRAVTLEHYEERRDFPAMHWTTRLSAHNKFGTVSIREVYHRLARRFGASHPLIRQLFWRDFFSVIGFYFPRVFGSAFRSEYDSLEWENSDDKFQAWCEGRTGYPMVDAGMRELNISGFMHNRLRMITASFLVKDLHIDWRWGERYFAQKLLDYDPAVNNGNWQWTASTGCDAQPHFRVFNPWLQQRRFDPDCRYIKRWVPELAGLSSEQIHSLRSKDGTAGYPPPIVDHDEARAVSERMFARAATARTESSV